MFSAQNVARNLILVSKADLKIDWCTNQAAKYACANWHYSKTMPRCGLIKVGAWEKGKFIGVVIFSWGATQHLGKPYGLVMTECCELTRIALTKHKSPVSRILSIAIRFLKIKSPGLRLIVSFADPEQNHHGGIYQATNWVYSGRSNPTITYQDRNGRKWHARNVGVDLRKNAIQVLRKDCIAIKVDGKHRYLMPLDEEMKDRIQKLSKPYPKRLKQAMAVQQHSGGVAPT